MARLITLLISVADHVANATGGRRDRNDPRAMQDDWAHGVDISGLDEETVRHLIHQVNLEFGDPPTPEPEVVWKEHERAQNSKSFPFNFLYFYAD
jgi:hypothetical protein